jgi:hypothetical protein
MVGSLAIGLLAGSAQADPSEYGFESVDATASTTQAGGHPNLTLSLRLKKEAGGEQLPSTTSEFIVELPPGLLANPLAVPRCTAAQLVSTDPNDPTNATGCPQASQVGISKVELFRNGELLSLFEPVFNMEHRLGEPARLGFIADVFPVFVDTELRSGGAEPDYGASARIEGASGFVPVLSAITTLWETPAAESHDSQRITAYEAVHSPEGTPHTPNGRRSANLVPVPFVFNPTRCGIPQGVSFEAIPYALPDLHAEAFAPLAPNTGCGALDFWPEMSIMPTSDEAQSGAGLDVALNFPTEGLENPDLPVEAAQKRVEVTLPEGLTINPSQAVGLGACSEDDFARETADSAPGVGCPESAKVGAVTAQSPLSEELAEGSVFVATPYENRFGSMIALYVTLKIPNQGVIVKLSGEVTADPKTGQLTSTFDDIPQLPVSSFKLHFREGARSALVTPPTCGTYQSTANFTSWSDPAHHVTLFPAFELGHGPNGGPCPTGTAPFDPTFTAGAINNNAASFSPYYLRLGRADDDQELTRFSMTLPPGALAKLAGVSRCSDAAIEAASARARKASGGAEELANPSCPASSYIGHVLAGAGVGTVLTHATGKIYLAGPYQGDPLSVVAVVPAIAGPFDVGTVVTRQALALKPETGVAQLDGSRSDPIPHILAGIPLRVRDVRAYVDRPEFTLNPTSCDREQFEAVLWGGGLDPFSSSDDFPLSRNSRFQAANCALLGFKPKLSLGLSGGTHRGAHPALKAVLRMRPGDANIAAAQVTLPRSAFIEQAHFRTICTRVQFAVHQCPAGSVYGHVTAFSPLLDEPLEGPAYLRSSVHKLPDLVLALHGIVDVDVVGRVDSVKGRLRSTFESVPDAPVSKVVLSMEGGRKGLFVNSTDLCRKVRLANAEFDGQNGKTKNFNPVVKSNCRQRAKRGRGQRKINR